MNDTYLKTKKILIVDDEECLRSMLITILEDENFYNIVTADCVKSALEICQQERPDISCRRPDRICRPK
jgi:DNA-binding NtrC family response regulator